MPVFRDVGYKLCRLLSVKGVKVVILNGHRSGVNIIGNESYFVAGCKFVLSHVFYSFRNLILYRE